MLKDAYYIDINLGNACNYRCSYCYESPGEYRGGEISDETVDKSIEFVNQILKMTERDVSIDFWGGEPLLHVDKILKIMSYYKDNDRVEFLIFTNGHYLSEHLDEFEEFKNKLTIQVSYDFEPVNSLRRIDINNVSHSDITRAVIQEIDKRNFMYMVKSTMTWNDIQYHLAEVYEDFYNFANTLGNRITLGITPDSTTVANSIIDEKLVERQLKKLLMFFAKHGITDTRFNWFSNYSAKAVCHSIKTGCLIDTDGGIYPCHGCSFMNTEGKKNFYISSVYETDCYSKFMKFLSKDISLSTKKCEQCKTEICYRCNAINATKYTYTLDSWDAPNSDIECKLNMLVTKYIWAFRKMNNK